MNLQWSGLMKKNNALIVLGTGLLVAVIAGLLAFGWLHDTAKTQAHAAETQLATVAATDLKWGTVISKEQVKAVPFLKRTLPAGYFANPAKLEGRTLVYPVKANEPIFESRLAPSNVRGGGIAAVIGAEKRAMAVKVDKVIGVAGFVHPGDRVDVIVTLNRTDRITAPITKTVMESVLVLATGSEVEKTGKNEKSIPVDVITLEVGVDEGEKLALAATEGKLQLALRNLADSRHVTTKGTTIPALLSSLRGADIQDERRPVSVPKKPARPIAEPSGPPLVSVDVIKGTSMSALKFQKGE
jgi:pilus assembly protein CpaB